MNLSLTQYLRSKQPTYVQRISQQHADILARVARRKAQAAHKANQQARRADLLAWLRDRRRAIAERCAIIAGSVALTLLVSLQPANDALSAKDAEIAAITQQRNVWQAVATRDATSHMTINLTGPSREVRKSVRAIADLEK